LPLGRSARVQLLVTNPGTAPVVGGQVVPPGAGLPPGPAPVPGTGGGVSMGVSSKSVKPGAMPGVAAPVDDYTKQIAQMAKEEQALLAAQGEIGAERAKSDANVIREQMTQRDKLMLERQQADAAEMGEMRRYESGLRDLQAQVLDLSKQSVDPNRFWNNKSDGQKAMSVIAGALVGFTGQGMQWLQRLDGLVEQDIQAQAADLNRQRGLLGDASQMQNNLVAMAESRGLRGKAAYDAAVATQKEQMATQLQLNALNYAQPELRAKAEAAALAIRQSAAKDIASYQMKAREESMNARLKAAQIAKLTAETQSTRLDMGLKGATGGVKPKSLTELKPAQQERLSDLLTIGDKIGEMKREYDAKAGAPYSPVTAQLGLGMQATDASKWKNSSQKFFAQTIGTTLEGGKLTDADFPKYVEGFIPSAADTSGAATNKTENLVKYAVDKYKNELRTLAAGNFYVRPGELPSPEEYEAALRERAGLTSKAPSYASPR
jgi:hypothetical protein